ncbi:translation initiation factor eIF-2B epsilon subunit, GEF [Coemansia spiralis]|uniref:Translation initiation factor eIF2B subunit epsilon n=2 Tax=Coemansia TaxID=4863 RepID=A0A9W8GCX7_9FUNG|nr:translation initiation factor eIF-2B epsilon subunit, GEF [Coemansia umbellata]KAJ2624126.1 translation initiation factor eIF-2B epsilon subunit, GEF [Coemansia sp. RSA 1358]KAJ2680837.1 translation initiation factor eIF-2B epsilon subunit, GEF [Coemansia spiralis]
MAPGKSNSNSKVELEEELKAVVLADSFDDLFQPLALNRPRCLLPLCNVPMIEYTLEFLSSSGVRETILICKSHADRLQAYIKQSKWGRSSHSSMKIRIKVARTAESVGDALRDIDNDTGLRSDFILCTGMVVSNMDLSKLVAAHMANKRNDKDHIMTVLLQEASQSHRLRDKSDESVYLIDPSSNKLLGINSFPSLPKPKSMTIQTEVIISYPEVELRADLVDTNIFVCSPQVLALFTENFDYQTMRRDFIHGILASDLLSSSIYAHVLAGTSTSAPENPEDDGLDAARDADVNAAADTEFDFINHSGYAAGVIDTSAYDSISRDLIGRWAYPLCPDSSPVDGAVYTYNRGCVYKAQSVFLGRESYVERNVVLGPNSHVADFARVLESVLGAKCSVGERSVVRGAYLFDEATVGKGSVIERTIIGERVTILDNVVIERGCIIGDDVTIGPNIRIPSFTHIARRKPQSSNTFSDDDLDGYSDEEESNSGSEGQQMPGSNTAEHEDHETSNGNATVGMQGTYSSEPFDTHVLGSSGIGYVWSKYGQGNMNNSDADSDDYDYDYADNEGVKLRQLRAIGSYFADIEIAENELKDEESDEHSSDQEQEIENTSPMQVFERELRLTIARAFERNHSIEDTAFEISNVRLSYNGDQNDMRRIVAQEILGNIDLGGLPTSAKKVLSRWGGVIKRCISNEIEQVEVVDIVERYCALDPAVSDDLRSRLFRQTIPLLYEFDIVEDLAIIAWYNKAVTKSSDEVSRELVQKIEVFVDWLNESEEEEDDDDDDDNDEESDDE